MATSDNITILAFAGSLRKDSYNKALLRAAKKLAPKEMKIEFFDLEGIPFFSEDVEAEGDPDYVTQFKEAIRKADGLLIATPEYNYGMSSATKAAIEWASRRIGRATCRQRGRAEALRETVETHSYKTITR